MPEVLSSAAPTAERRAWSGIVAGAVGFASVALQNVLIVPLLLSRWGAEEYALWVSLLAAQGLLQSVDVGHQAFIGNELTRTAHESRAEFGRVLGSSFVVAALLGLLQLVALAVVLAVAGPGRLLGLDLARFGRADIALWVLVGTWVVTWSLGGILVKAYNSLGLYARSVWWAVAMRLLQTASVVAVVWNRGSYVSAAVAFSAAWAAVGVASLFDIVSLLRRAGLLDLRVDLRLGFGNAARSLVVCGAGMLDQVGGSGVILVIGRSLGLAALAPFTTLRTLVNTGVQAANLMLLPVAPELIRLRATDRRAEVREALQVADVVCAGLINLVIVLTLPIAALAFRLWTHGVVAFDLPLYLLLAFAVMLRNGGAPITAYLQAINAIRFQASTSIGRNTCALAGAILAATLGSITYLGAGILLGEVVASLIMPAWFARPELPPGTGPAVAWTETLVVAAVTAAAIARPEAITGIALVGAAALGAVLFAKWSRIPAPRRHRLIAAVLGRPAS